MNWQYLPKGNGIEVTVLTHFDALLGFQIRSSPLGFSINLFHISFYISWFNRTEYEQDIELLKGGNNES